MARRVISQNVAVFVGGTQITRAQTANYSFSLNKEPVQIMGQLAPIDQIALEPPTATMDFSWLAVDSTNEAALGLDSGMSRILNGSEAEKAYAITVSPNGTEASEASGVVGVGMAYISNYSAEGSLGAFPTASVTVEGSTMASSATGNTISIAGVDENCASKQQTAGGTPAALGEGETSVIVPGNIEATISGNTGIVSGSFCLTSYEISVDMTREPLQCLGCFWPSSRDLQFPIPVTVNIEASLGDVGDVNLETVFCEELIDISITLYETDCEAPNLRGAPTVTYSIVGATLNSQSANVSIGPNATVTAGYTAFIGGPGDTKGFFIS